MYYSNLPESCRCLHIWSDLPRCRTQKYKSNVIVGSGNTIDINTHKPIRPVLVLEDLNLTT